MKSISFVRALGLAALSLLACAGAAGSQRTFVASTGVDSASCTLIAPCRTFDAAIAAVSAGGEVLALDSAGYGPFTIQKSVTVVAPPGVYAGITVASGIGIQVEGSAGMRVVLRGLALNDASTSYGAYAGIRVVSVGSNVEIDRCTFTGLARGVLFMPSTQGRLYVTGSTFSGGLVGLTAQPTGGGTNSHIEVWRSSFVNNAEVGISVRDVARASVAESLVAGNLVGISASATSAPAANVSLAVDRVQVHGNIATGLAAESTGSVLSVVNVSNSTFSGNTGEGIWAKDYSYVRMSGNTIGGNGTGVKVSPQSVGVGTLQTNLLLGNGFDYTGSMADVLTPF